MNQGEEQNPVRRVLKSLPTVSAKEDFEMRLSRSIAGKVRMAESESAGEKLIGSRVRAYGLSLVALVAVGLVAYYAFLRTGMNPLNDMESKPAIETGQHDTGFFPTLPRGPGASRPMRSRTESANVSVSEISRSREAAQGELLRRGALQQVGGGETQSAPPFEMPGTPALRQMRRVIMERDSVSAARLDSGKRDSLKRLELRKAKETGKK